MSKLQNFPELNSLVEEISAIIEENEDTNTILYYLFDNNVSDLFYHHPELSGWNNIFKLRELQLSKKMS